MGTRTEYAPGSFCWVDLATTDPEGAKRFYGELFGWEAEEVPAGPGRTYTMFRLRGHEVAAVAAQMADERALGIPPHWSSYVSVDSADKAAARARELGGTVHMDPFDVLDAGRMTIVTDPQGAVFHLWEPRGRPGAGLVNELGALVWNHFMTPDPSAAAEFYSGVLGWSTEAAGGGTTVVRVGERLNGGMAALAAGSDMPPHWAVFFTVADMGEATERAAAIGGRVVQPPTDVGWGTIANVLDPQGAAVGLFEGDVEA